MKKYIIINSNQINKIKYLSIKTHVLEILNPTSKRFQFLIFRTGINKGVVYSYKSKQSSNYLYQEGKLTINLCWLFPEYINKLILNCMKGV